MWLHSLLALRALVLVARATTHAGINVKLLNLGGGFTMGLSLLPIFHLNTWAETTAKYITLSLVSPVVFLHPEVCDEVHLSCHIFSAFFNFSEFFDCFRISETKRHFPSWETLLTWNNLVINRRSAQKQPTSTPPCRWAASFGANSEDVLRDKGNLQTNYTREWKAALRWDKTLDVGSSDDLWAAENVLVCISYESFSSWWWSN